MPKEKINGVEFDRFAITDEGINSEFGGHKLTQVDEVYENCVNKGDVKACMARLVEASTFGKCLNSEENMLMQCIETHVQSSNETVVLKKCDKSEGYYFELGEDAFLNCNEEKPIYNASKIVSQGEKYEFKKLVPVGDTSDQPFGVFDQLRLIYLDEDCTPIEPDMSHLGFQVQFFLNDKDAKCLGKCAVAKRVTGFVVGGTKFLSGMHDEPEDENGKEKYFPTVPFSSWDIKEVDSCIVLMASEDFLTTSFDKTIERSHMGFEAGLDKFDDVALKVAKAVVDQIILKGMDAFGYSKITLKKLREEAVCKPNEVCGTKIKMAGALLDAVQVKAYIEKRLLKDKVK